MSHLQHCLVALLAALTIVSCERFPYSANVLCDHSLTNQVGDPLISVDGATFLKGYCRSRKGWATLQQTQTPGWGSYGGILAVNEEILAANDTVVQGRIKVCFEIIDYTN